MRLSTLTIRILIQFTGCLIAKNECSVISVLYLMLVILNRRRQHFNPDNTGIRMVTVNIFLPYLTFSKGSEFELNF